MKRLAFLAVLLLPLAAHAQCAGGLIGNCPGAVSPQNTDIVLGWQPGQNPHTRAFTLGQIVTQGGSGVFLPLTGGSLSGSLSVTGTAALNGGGALVGVFSGGFSLGGTVGAAGSFSNLVPSTFGGLWNGAGHSVIVNCPSCAPGVFFPDTPSQVATYSGRDSVALFASNYDRAPIITLSNPTYDTTHLYPATALSPTQVASVRIGAFVETNDSPKFTGVITAVAANGTSITIGGGWYQLNNTSSGQTPAGTTAYVDVETTPFAANFTVTYTGAYANGIGATALELDMYQQTSFTLGNLYSTVGDTPISNALQIVSPGTDTAGTGLAVNGKFARGVLVMEASAAGFIYGPTSGTGFLSGQTSGNGFEIRNPTTGITTASLTAPSTLNLGTESGGSTTQPTIALYSSANGVVDSKLWGVGGSSTTLNGTLRYAGFDFEVYGESGTSGDDIAFQVPSGGGGVISMTTANTNSPLSLKSRGTGNVGIYGNTSGFDAPVAIFHPVSVTGANQTNELSVTAALTGVAPVITVQGVDTNTGLTIEPLGTGALTLGVSTGTIALAGTAFSMNGTSGVSCTGSPTSSFASVNGIVTHC